MPFCNLFSYRKQTVYFVLAFLFSIGLQGQVFFNDLEGSFNESTWIGLKSIDSGNAYSGRFYSHTDSVIPYGLGIEQDIPSSLSNINTKLYIDCYVRSNSNNNNALFVVTIVNNNETIMWKGLPITEVSDNGDEWFRFTDSILIPASLTSKSKIKSYLWNQGKNFTTDIDDLRIEFAPNSNPTYIPEIKIENVNNDVFTDFIVLFENDYFSVNYNNSSNKLSILSNTGENIFNNISYYSNKVVGGSKIISQINWKHIRTKNIDKGKELRFKASIPGSKLKLSIECMPQSGNINFIVSERYAKKQEVSRESIIINYAQPLSQVYRSNRKMDTINFQSEYWLNKQGVKVGTDNNSMIIYHTTNISSLQLDTKKQLLFANLDYEKDHPFFRFPLNPDSNNWKKEESSSTYKRGNKRSYQFNISIGNNAYTIPRFMKNPDGYEATYIWTEHADYTDIRTNRATYFGSENIISANSATGGFVFYNIPVTKSVFYANPDSISNHQASHGEFNTLESTIISDDEFSDFLFQIAKKGNEICLHTPEQFTTTPSRLKEALLYMQLNFKSPSWIDHGNNNGPKNNREDLICDATLKKSPYYAVDLWNIFGVKYLHNAYYEELSTFKDWQFEGSLEKPFSGYGDFIPKPDYYQHPTKTQNLYHWTTTSALFIKESFLWEYLFNIKKLTKMVDNWHVEINHVYPAWVDPKKGMWTWDSDSTIIAQPGLNMALSNLSQLRNEGRLNVTTIADFLNYSTNLDNVDYDIQIDGRIKVTNNNDVIIEGLSMVAKAQAITVDQLIPHHKKIGNDIIFWFNIAPGESKIIRLIE